MTTRKKFINNSIYIGKYNPMDKKIEYIFLTYTNDQPGAPGFYFTSTDEGDIIEEDPDSIYIYYLSEMDPLKEKNLEPLTKDEIEDIKNDKIKLFFINGYNYNPKRMFLSNFEKKYKVEIKGFLNVKDI